MKRSGADPSLPTLDNPTVGRGAGWPRLPISVPVFLLMAIVAALWAADLRTTYHSPILLAALNLVFGTLVSLFIACLAGRSFLKRGTPGLLLLGCGMVFWGASCLAGTLVAHGDVNATMTIRATCVRLSALCHLAGVCLSFRPKLAVRAAGLWLTAAYTAALGAVALAVRATLAGWAPVFFVPGQGGTPVRQLVLGSAIIMFVVTAILLRLANRRSPSVFAYWYSLALALTAVGLFGVMLQPDLDSLLSWAGRTTQYLGGAFMLVAAIASARESREWGIPLEVVLSEARQQFDELFELAADGIVVHELASGPTRGKILQANRAICDLLGSTQKEMCTLGVLDITAPEDHPALDQAREALTHHDVLRHEKTLLTKDGRRIHAELHSRLYQHQGRPTIMSVIRDVTERKRAEEALRESEARYRGLMDLAPDAVLVYREGRIVYGNAAAARLCDKESIEQLLGRSIVEMAHPDERAAAQTRIQRLLEGGAASLHEYRYQRPNGEEVRVEARGALVGWQGQPAVQIVLRDISARKRAEEALRESEARYRGLVELAPDAVLVHQGGCIVYCNAAAARLCDVESTEQLLGRGVLDTIHPDEREVAQRRIQRLLEGGTTSLHEYRHRRPNGEEVPVGVMSALVGWQGQPAVQIIVRDISARKRAEESLRRSEALYRAMARSIPDGAVWVVDTNLRVMVVEGDLATRIGLGRERVEGRSLAEAFDEAWRRQLADQRFRVALGGQTASYETEFHGRALWTQYVPLHDPAGQVIAAMALALDITERKRVEARLRQAQKLESIGLLAGGIAHDFNNLLIGVVGNASLALDMLPRAHPVVELLQRIAKAGEHAAHLTRQMLAYSGGGQFLMEPVDLSEVAAEMSELVRSSIPKKAALHLDLARDLPPVEADRGQIQQVVMNLLLNAGEAIGGNTGLITVQTGVQAVDEGHPRQDLEGAELRPGDYVFLEVRDTGCGMSEATQARIFEPFFTTKFTGRGLGLAAVVGILRGHQGAIEVTSEPGKGSCFVVLLPAAVVAPSPPPVPARDRKVLRGRRTVLVVDDEELVRQMAKRSLERLGFEVFLADSGLAAIELLKTAPKRISLVILDLSMPGMSGAEILPELRKSRSRIKVLVSSGYGQAEALRALRGQRVAGFIQKPYTSSQLAETVMSAIG